VPPWTKERVRIMGKIKVVHYINQFFAGIGGEEKADYKPEIRKGFVGPGMALNAGFKGEVEIVATIICGDSYFNENIEEAKAEIIKMVKSYNPDMFIAGPAFNAGRYGVACGTIADAVYKELGIPVLTGMYVENPGADMFKKSIYIVSTKNSAAGMRDAVKKMVPLALKLAKGEEIGMPEEEEYIPRGIRKNYFAEERGSARAVDMMIKKLKGEEFTTEFPMPKFDRVKPNPPIKDIAHAKIALVTSGGIVPKGNPDHIESSSASKYGKYDIEGVNDLTSETYQTAHGGYDPVYANDDPDRVLPVDIMRDLEREGKIGSLHRYYYATVGNGTAVANAKKYAANIAKDLVADKVDAVILTST
jgi:glycine reductase